MTRTRVYVPISSVMLLLLTCLLAAQAVQAAPVDPKSAIEAAAGYLQSHRGARLGAPSAVPTLRLAHAEPSLVRPASACFYVLNADDGSAFVIASGDDRARAVLACGEGTLDMSRLPCNLEWMLRAYREQMEYLHAHPAEDVQQAPPYNDVTIPPLLTCNWSQGTPFNDQCPLVDGERSVTGCIATAMAQVMYYWRYPARTPSLGAYTTFTHRIAMPSLPSLPLEWGQMTDVYAGVAYTPQQGAAVARLMLYCGQSSQMDYSPDGSGTYVRNQLQGMRAFGYSNDMSMVDKPNYDIETWDAMMQQDLLAGRPILYSGVDGLSGGHAFVLDGYYDGRYHINWGWGGTGDGYFALDAFVVRGYSFTARQQMLHCVHPPVTEAQEGYDFVNDGIYYMYDEEGTALLVSYKDTHYNSYEGDVEIPAQVTHDGETLPVVGIGTEAFRNCTSLTSVKLPSTIQSIGDRAFMGCVTLREAVIPQGVMSIGTQAFAYCYDMTRMAVPAGLKAIGGRAFVDCRGLQRIEAPSLDSWLAISFADETSNPLSQAHHLYIQDKELTALELTAGQPSLVGQYAFAGCEGLTRVTLGTVTAIGKGSFKDCTAISSLSLGGPLAVIESDAFRGCTSLSAVEVPATVMTMGTSVFAACTALQSTQLPPAMTVVRGGTFNGCSSLSSVSLPVSLTAIEASAFNGCSSLQQLSLPVTLTTIGASAFAGCTSLEQVLLPASLTSMGSGAYSGCSALHTVSLPTGLAEVPQQAFMGCNALKAVTIPDGVTAIGEQAFYKCLYLLDVSIGKDVTMIGNGAFDNDPRVRSVTCRAMVPPVMEHTSTFVRSVYKNAALHVPSAAVADYRSTGIWSWFKTVEALPDSVTGDLNGDGEVTVADVNVLLDTLITGHGTTAPMDVNGDGEITLADVNALIGLILAAA